MSKVDGSPWGGLPRLADDTPAEESIGQRDLTRWPTAAGRALVRLVRLVGRLATQVPAQGVLYATLLIGLVIVVAFARQVRGSTTRWPNAHRHGRVAADDQHRQGHRRPRPPLSEAVPPYEYAFSFPSGHTLNSTVIAGVVAYLLLRRLRATWSRTLTVVPAVVWAVIMGLSRVFLATTGSPTSRSPGCSASPGWR